MTNPNVIGRIGPIENRSRPNNQSVRPYHQDKQQFYFFHPPMPTENGKMLQECFDKRTEIERKKISLEKEKRNFVNKFDNLNNELIKVIEKPANSLEEQIAKDLEIDSIQKEIDKVTEELIKVRKKIEEKDNEIDKANEKINGMIEIVLEDEHNLTQQQQELEKNKDYEKVESLIAQL